MMESASYLNMIPYLYKEIHFCGEHANKNFDANQQTLPVCPNCMEQEH
jgi:NADH pyrophosphatase NudC (nudix superfamily)